MNEPGKASWRKPVAVVSDGLLVTSFRRQRILVRIGTYLLIFAVILVASLVSASDTDSQDEESQNRPHVIKQGLEGIAQLDSNFAQELALMRLADVSDVTALHTLLDQSEELASSKFRDTVQSVAIRKLATFEPKNALKRVEDLDEETPSTLVSTVFQEWSILDLEAAIQYISALDPPLQRDALNGILHSRSDLDPQRVQAIAQQFELETVADDFAFDSMARRPLDNPEEAWRKLLDKLPTESFQDDDSQLDYVAHVIKAIWEKEGRKGLRRLDKSLHDHPRRVRLVHSFLDLVAENDPDLALELAIDLNRNKEDLMASQRILRWAGDDPQAALHATLTTRNKALREDFSRAYSLASAPDEVSQTIIDEMANYPYSIMAKVFSGQMYQLIYSDPEVATQYLHLIDDHREKLRLAQLLTTSLSRKDVGTALTWVKSDPEIDEIRDQLLPLVMWEMTYVDPDQAIQIALEQSAGETEIGAEAAVLQELAKFDLARAIEFLPRMRNSKTKYSAAGTLGRRAIENGQSRVVKDISEHLTESQQSRFYESLLPYWASDDPHGLCEILSQLPGDEVKVFAAESLYVNNERSGGELLDAGQKRTVESYLTQDARNRLSEFTRKIENLRYALP